MLTRLQGVARPCEGGDRDRPPAHGQVAVERARVAPGGQQHQRCWSGGGGAVSCGVRGSRCCHVEGSLNGGARVDEGATGWGCGGGRRGGGWGRRGGWVGGYEGGGGGRGERRRGRGGGAGACEPGRGARANAAGVWGECALDSACGKAGLRQSRDSAHDNSVLLGSSGARRCTRTTGPPGAQRRPLCRRPRRVAPQRPPGAPPGRWRRLGAVGRTSQTARHQPLGAPVEWPPAQRCRRRLPGSRMSPRAPPRRLEAPT